MILYKVASNNQLLPLPTDGSLPNNAEFVYYDTITGKYMALGNLSGSVGIAKQTDIDAVTSQLADTMGFNNYSVIPTYTNGQLTKVEEKDGLIIKQSSTITYNLDGTVATVTEVYNGKTVVSTLNYVNGEFNSATKEVV